MSDGVTVNTTQKLYVIPFYGVDAADNGYTCLGFDVAHRRALSYAKWLNVEYKPSPEGSMALYYEYERLKDQIREICQREKLKCLVELQPRLIGAEGRRVRITSKSGDVRVFRLGRSTGWMPIHLEVYGSDGGGEALFVQTGDVIEVLSD